MKSHWHEGLKEFYDEATVLRSKDLEQLKQDIVDTFQRRETHPVPRALELPPEFWGTVFAKLALECEIDGDGDIHAQFEKVSRYCRAILLRQIWPPWKPGEVVTMAALS